MKACELIFKPGMNGLSNKGMPDLVWESVKKSDIDVRKDLCQNIIMSGGSTMYEGIQERLKAELKNRAPAGADIRVIASEDRKFAVFKGASILSSLSTFGSSWITKEDYEEHGARIVHTKCV